MLLRKLFCIVASVVFFGFTFASYASDSETPEPEREAYDFSAADEQYAKREKSVAGLEAIRKSLALYRRALGSVSGDDMLYAVSQISRLYIFEGDMTRKLDERKARMRTFDNCLDTLDEYLHPDEFGATPNYYYFKVYCLALWGKSAGPLRILTRTGTLKKAIKEGMKLDTRYEGGGLPRMTAAIYLNSKAKPIGLYKPKKALELVESAIASEAVEDPAYPTPLGGADIIENYYHYAEALLKNRKKEEALEVLEQTVEEYEELIELDELPEGREPEAKYYLERVKTRLEAYKKL